MNKNSQDIKRLKLGIIFNFESSWMGGIIYIINIIKTLNFLEDNKKPQIYLFYNPDLKKFLDEIEYPYINFIEWTFPSITKGHFKSWLSRKNLFIDDILKNYSLDAIYPLQDFPVRPKTSVKLVSWCTDFQYKHYPEFFSKKQIFGRDLRTRFALRNNNDLVLSSKSALADINLFFKIPPKLQIHIYRFVSIIDNQDKTDINSLKTKYNLPEKYFLVSNQFHKHKNHKVLLLSLLKLKNLGHKTHLALTGKFPAAADSPYLNELHTIIDQNNLQEQITLLGIISRSDQLQLMRHAQAVVQPSLFEGWSTVIEDAKSLQVPVIASNLDVNIEQLGDKAVYFDPNNPDDLSLILKDYPERNVEDVFYEEYPKRVKEAAETLLRIFEPVEN